MGFNTAKVAQLLAYREPVGMLEIALKEEGQIRDGRKEWRVLGITQW